ncbi:putative ArsR family transcriptional regulator [Nocardioides thalensis]|uniref:Putative ArsR family transcriptional regulator n=1 Tax=Nocardioides thalensis TaxID=1914755 RepID=A0A853C0P0_9ACTN|nr:helix-turn-helix domain-containing protein [Nocardioides thalensis]NYJ00178.1 putative ArsR family transcriptional regulator [Nocardioides thalensis]
MPSIDKIRAIHHPTRRRIIDYLGVNGPAQVGALADALGQQVGSISHHLRVLERQDVVARVPELAHDRRTSWWRLESSSISWSVDDFATVVDRMTARAAQRANIDHQLRKLAEWMRRADDSSQEWREAATSSDLGTVATAAELKELGRRLLETAAEWSSEIDRDDGQEREPVFLFLHAFPTRP